LIRRVMIFIVSVAVGLSLAAMSRGEWPRGGTEAAGLFAPSGTGPAARDTVAKMAGLTPVTGPGLTIRIDDAAATWKKEVPIERLIVHERDLLQLRNELFSAGAEAVSINGLRMVATSVIRCVGPAIRINDTFTTPPYVIKAEGDPETLKQAVMMMGGVIDVISSHNLKVDVTEEKNTVVPAYSTDGTKNTASATGGGR
jgi:uncharacterized protein YlxW (UPF0749 family)